MPKRVTELPEAIDLHEDDRLMVVEQLQSKQITFQLLVNKLKSIFKIGDTDISEIGSGTLSSAVAEINRSKANKQDIYSKSEVYTKNEVYSKNEVYAKGEVYSKSETYSRNDLYTKTQILNAIYPVGSIYMSATNVSPASTIGGTWVRWGSGRVPVGVDESQSEFNTTEKAGGEKYHTLTEYEIPSHSHSQVYQRDTVVSNTFFGSDLPVVSSISAATVNTGNTGGSGAHNNLQPYITCYMWKRTS